MTTPNLRGRSRRAGSMLLTAVKPATGAHLARLRASELALPALHARPTIVAVHGLVPGLGASGLAALLAQALNGVAPARVAVLDADGVGQPLRAKLGAHAGGDTRQMTAARAVWRIRRAVERYRAPGSAVALYAAAGGSSAPFTAPETTAAVKVLSRRYPVLVVDLPIAAAADVTRAVLLLADHVVVVTAPKSSAAGFRLWAEQLNPHLRATTVTFERSHLATPVRARPSDVEIVLPEDRLFHRWAPARLGDASLPVLRAIETLVSRVAADWPSAR